MDIFQGDSFKLGEFISKWGWLPLLTFGFTWLYASRESERKRASIEAGQEYAFFTLGRFLAGTSALLLASSTFMLGRSLPYESWFIDYSRPFYGWTSSPDGFMLEIKGDDLYRHIDTYDEFSVGCRPYDLRRGFEADNRKVSSEVLPIRRSEVPQKVIVEVSEEQMEVFRNYRNAECRILLLPRNEDAEPRLMANTLVFPVTDRASTGTAD